MTNTFTAHWKETIDGKEIKHAASFDTKEERNACLRELKAAGKNVYRFTDFEIFEVKGN